MFDGVAAFVCACVCVCARAHVCVCFCEANGGGTLGWNTNHCVCVCVCVCVYQVNWEEYMWSKEATLSQMPVGIWQYPQDMKKGIGEPYVPILRLEDLPK